MGGNVVDDKIKYVNRSSYRVKVLKTLGEDAKIPTQIASDSGILPNHISNVLSQLKEKDIVGCINPEVRKGRLYRLSDEGLSLLKK